MESKPDLDKDAEQVLCNQCAGPNPPDATRCVHCHSPLASALSWGSVGWRELLVRGAVRGPFEPGAQVLLVLVLLFLAALVGLGVLNDWGRSSRANDLLGAAIVLVLAYVAWRALRRLLRRG